MKARFASSEIRRALLIWETSEASHMCVGGNKPQNGFHDCQPLA